MTEDVTFISGKCDVNFRNNLMQLRSNGSFVSTQIVICTSLAVLLLSSQNMSRIQIIYKYSKKRIKRIII